MSSCILRNFNRSLNAWLVWPEIEQNPQLELGVMFEPLDEGRIGTELRSDLRFEYLITFPKLE